MTASSITPTGTTRGRAWTSLILGVLVFLVPFATGSYNTHRNFAYDNYAIGIVVVVLAAIGIWAAARSMVTLAWLEGINALAGLWTIAAPFVFVSARNDMYANVILGVILAVVAGWDAYVGMQSRTAAMTRRGRTV